MNNKTKSVSYMSELDHDNGDTNMFNDIDTSTYTSLAGLYFYLISSFKVI